MTPNQLDTCADVCGQIAKLAMSMPEEQQRAAQMALIFTMAQLFITEFRVHAARGNDAYDAMLKSIRGDLEIPQTLADEVDKLRLRDKK